jgi:hypothetical protein
VEFPEPFGVEKEVVIQLPEKGNEIVAEEQVSVAAGILRLYVQQGMRAVEAGKEGDVLPGYEEGLVADPLRIVQAAHPLSVDEHGEKLNRPQSRIIHD